MLHRMVGSRLERLISLYETEIFSESSQSSPAYAWNAAGPRSNRQSTEISDNPLWIQLDLYQYGNPSKFPRFPHHDEWHQRPHRPDAGIWVWTNTPYLPTVTRPVSRISSAINRFCFAPRLKERIISTYMIKMLWLETWIGARSAPRIYKKWFCPTNDPAAASSLRIVPIVSLVVFWSLTTWTWHLHYPCNWLHMFLLFLEYSQWKIEIFSI